MKRLMLMASMIFILLSSALFARDYERVPGPIFDFPDTPPVIKKRLNFLPASLKVTYGSPYELSGLIYNTGHIKFNGRLLVQVESFEIEHPHAPLQRVIKKI